MSRRFGIIKGLAALIFGSTAILFRPTPLPESGRDPSRPYELAPAARPRPAIERRPRMVVCSGRVESIHGEVEVSALIAGRLEEVRVTDGDTVEQGDILAVLEGGRQTEELRVAEANVAVARLKLQQV